MIEPRCLENHHNDDGTLIVYMGSTKPCLGCKSRERCFELFVAHKDKKRTIIKPPRVPDMVPAIPFPKCCGTCQNAIPISTTSNMVVCSCDNKQKNENRVCRNLYVMASLW
jgi:hypothetical protein